MNACQMKAMLLEIIGTLDYDLGKHFDPNLSEAEPDEIDEQINELIEIVKKWNRKH